MRPQCTHRQRRYGEARALLLAAWSLSACNQTYLIPERSLPPAAGQEKAPVDALRESDGQRLLLDPASLRRDTATEPLPSPGLARVRSARAGRMWSGASLLTGLGGMLAVTGAVVAISNMCLLGGCPPNPERERIFATGIALHTIGDVSLLVGPFLFVAAGALESRAVELGPAPSR